MLSPLKKICSVFSGLGAMFGVSQVSGQVQTPEYQAFLGEAYPSKKLADRKKEMHSFILTVRLDTLKQSGEKLAFDLLAEEGWENIELIKTFLITKEALDRDPFKRNDLEKAVTAQGVLIVYPPE